MVEPFLLLLYLQLYNENMSLKINRKISERFRGQIVLYRTPMNSRTPFPIFPSFRGVSFGFWSPPPTKLTTPLLQTCPALCQALIPSRGSAARMRRCRSGTLKHLEAQAKWHQVTKRQTKNCFHLLTRKAGTCEALWTCDICDKLCNDCNVPPSEAKRQKESAHLDD